MSIFNSLVDSTDLATKNAVYAALICLVAGLTGILIAQAADLVSAQGYLPMGSFLVTLYLLLGACWLTLTRQPKAFDPTATFITFISCTVASRWILQFFFIDAAIGPFGDDLWTAQNLLGNAIFGTSLFMLLGATLGATYYVARNSCAPVGWRRTIIYTIGVGLPVACITRAEFLFVALTS